jgi:hypothetical protein
LKASIPLSNGDAMRNQALAHRGQIDHRTPMFWGRLLRYVGS